MGLSRPGWQTKHMYSIPAWGSPKGRYLLLCGHRAKSKLLALAKQWRQDVYRAAALLLRGEVTTSSQGLQGQQLLHEVAEQVRQWRAATGGIKFRECRETPHRT